MILSDVCELIVDCPHSTAKDEGEGYPLIRTPNIGKGRLLLEGVHRVSQEVYDKRNFRAVPQKNDLIFAREAPAGNVAIIKDEKVCLGQRTVLIRPNTDMINPDFLVYFLLSPKQQYGLLGTANGATVAHVNIPTIRNLPIEIPDIFIQNKIADILSNYDNLIENNQKQIKLLEETAQRLYKEWFVDLHFSGYESATITDGVPEGWKECAIIDLCEKINAGGTPSRRNASYWNDATIKWYKTQELQDCWLIDSSEKISVTGQQKSSAKFFPKNTILMAIYASPTLGRLGILDSEATCNQAAICLKADEEKISWQWLYEKLYELRDYYNGIARGAGQQNISGDVVKQTIVLCPPKEIIDRYTNIVSPMFEKRRLLQKQVFQLTEARDRLLPKLMNGEIEV